MTLALDAHALRRTCWTGHRAQSHLEYARGHTGSMLAVTMVVCSRSHWLYARSTVTHIPKTAADAVKPFIPLLHQPQSSSPLEEVAFFLPAPLAVASTTLPRVGLFGSSSGELRACLRRPRGASRN